MIAIAHVPRTGGTSLMDSVRGRYGDGSVWRPSIPFGDGVGFRACTTAALRRQWDAFPRKWAARLVCGHYPLSSMAQVFGPARVGVLARDPAARLVSWYGFDLKHARLGGWDPMPFEEWLFRRTPDGHPLRADTMGFWIDVDVRSVPFVGLQERYDESLALLRAVSGLEVESVRVNRTPPDLEVPVPQGFEDWYRGRSPGEFELYERCVEAFEAKLKEVGL